MTGRYMRLLPENRTQFAEDDLEALAHVMISDQERPTSEGEPDPEEDPQITAAYTYLGQFTDHDLTFDPTSRLREALTDQELEALADFRTPRFDLDNLYGRGPDDQPYMYEPDKIHMLLGEPLSGNPFDPERSFTPSSCGSTTRSPITSPKRTTGAESRASMTSATRSGGTISGCWSKTSCPASSTTTRTSASSPTPSTPLPRCRGSGAASGSCPWSSPWPPSASGTP
jgi:hypothetical protein